MKTLRKLTIMVLTLWSMTLMAQKGINYKALIKDGGGNVVANQNITVQFQILEGAGMVNVYQETHGAMTDANGMVIINIGEGTPDSGDYSTIDWGNDDHFLNVQIDTGGGLTDMGTTQFMAMPYALSVSSETIKINDLVDGKSDDDGSNDGSSLFLGIGAGLNDDGTDNWNIGLGFEALKNVSSGDFNTATGNQALLNNTIGNENSAYGPYALYHNIDGSQNMAFGKFALYTNANGDRNLGLGFQAGSKNISGNNNIFIGYQAGINETGSNKLYLESSAADPDNALIYGEFDNNILRTNSEFQIGNPSLSGYVLPTVDGTALQMLQTDGNGSLSWITPDPVTGLETLNEGNGIGWRLIGRNPSYYGNIGLNGVDLSYSAAFSSTRGATGDRSTAMGYRTIAEGIISTAMGSSAFATGLVSTALGSGTLASGDYSTAMGINTTANGLRSTAIGFSTTASGPQSTAMGYLTTATNNSSVAMGQSTIASGHSSTAMGSGTEATGEHSVAMGFGPVASGRNATAMGHNTRAEAYACLAIGRFNVGGGDPGNWNANDPVFEIGNGTSSASKSNAFTVFKNGNATLAGTLTQNSDARLKTEITNLDYGLKTILQLNPVSYYWKKDKDFQIFKSIGLIAQEVQPILKELVREGHDKDQLLSLNYEGIIPVLINAIKEQQEIIESQNTDIKSLTAELAENREDYKAELNAQRKSINQLLNRMQQLEQVNHQ